MKIPRSARISGEYQKAISEVISGALKNKCPDLTALISVTKADVSSDLKNATVFVSVYAKTPEESLRQFEIVKSHAGFIRHELSHMMEMRTVPELRFLPDNSMAYGDRIDLILKQIHREND
ncbi:MAG: 30S ribosome-binding factor RbfA [Clostridia bacterium]|nr:30S ribosome-binding factor RbfA [Clostridia bacterium]